MRSMFLHARRTAATTSKNHVKDMVQGVEASAAWGVGDGGYGLPRDKVIGRWLQIGKDPVLDAPVHATAGEMATRRAVLKEDILGTDLQS